MRGTGDGGQSRSACGAGWGAGSGLKMLGHARQLAGRGEGRQTLGDEGLMDVTDGREGGVAEEQADRRRRRSLKGGGGGGDWRRAAEQQWR